MDIFKLGPVLAATFFFCAHASAAPSCGMKFVDFKINPKSVKKHNPSTEKFAHLPGFTLVWPFDDGAELRIKRPKGSCTIPSDGFMVSTFYSKENQMFLVITDEGASNNTQHARFYDSKTCKRIGEDLKVYGSFGKSNDQLESPAYCISSDGEYSCSPAQIYDLSKECTPSKNNAKSMALTKKLLGQDLSVYIRFEKPNDPEFVKMISFYDQQPKPAYPHY